MFGQQRTVLLDTTPKSAHHCLLLSHTCGNELIFSSLIRTMVCFVQPKKKKNVTHDSFGSQLGRVHMQKQDVKKMQIRKLKGLKATREEKRAKLKARKEKETGE